jgi:4-amino-4-deoxy-L-arabinose transferase-like glycosyltransferase
VIHARRMSSRILYTLAGCILMLGVLSTQRKTGLVAPAAGMLTLVYFRRRELLRLAPLAVVLVITLVIVSPHTLAPVINQFKPQSLSGAGTVNDRTSDYDAIRPDVWTHLALGRGYGSYEPLGHRILDSQVLGTLVETGVLGLAAFILLGGSVIASARRTIHSRHPVWATSALAGAAAATTFLVLAFLFDSMGYPQLPYIFLCLAALVAVILKSPDDNTPPPTG